MSTRRRSGPRSGGHVGVVGGARAAAWRVLGRLSYRPHDARGLVDRELVEATWPASDRALLTELVYGTIKRRLTLDTIIRAYVSRPWATVDVRVADLLRLAVYQIVMLERVPRHAVVNETVELSRQVGLDHALRFVNGVLRAVAADIGEAIAEEPSPGAIPVHAGRWRPMRRNVLGQNPRGSVEYLSRAYSLPQWMLERWLVRMDVRQVSCICDFFNAPPPVWVRVNRAKADRDAVLAAMAAAGVAVEPGSHPDSVRIVGRGAPGRLPGFGDGWWLVQDVTAMHVADLAGLQPGSHVLDVCAAPGGKTTHVAALVGQGGRVVACDTSAAGLEQVRENCDRLGLDNVERRLLEADDGSDLPAGPFDAVVVDAPCSNTGVLGRRAEARWRVQPEHITRLCGLQARLLAAAAERVCPGGALVYATCSIEPEENAEIVAGLVRERDDLVCEQVQAFVPGRPSDGGWAARIRRRA